MEKKSNEKQEQKKQQVTRNTLITLSLITEIGVAMIANVGIGLLIGMFLDNWLNTTFLFLLIFSILGMMSGFRMVYLSIMRLEKRGGKK